MRITGNDRFYFSVANIAGSPVRDSEDVEVSVQSQTNDNFVNITSNTGTKVTESSTAGNYDPENGNGGYLRAINTDAGNWIKLSDLNQKTADGKATGTFIYEIYEKSEVYLKISHKLNQMDTIYYLI